MTARDKKQATFLGVLLVILGLTLYLAPGLNRAPTASGGQTAETAAENAAPAVSDARIRIDLIDRQPASPGAGDENLFQYRTGSSAPASPLIRPGAPASGATPAATPPPIYSMPAVPQGPPPPPPITLRYQGFARSESGSGELTAFLSDDRGRYNVRTGEVLMGRFRIVGITDENVEVEDLQFDRRQTLPLVR